ncbi:MAG TPA: hypothetical protein VM925_20895, partial [Labilithrix sp.]|nr:hypothetical protein [Labilithrix sp.]
IPRMSGRAPRSREKPERARRRETPRSLPGAALAVSRLAALNGLAPRGALGCYFFTSPRAKIDAT